MLTWIDSIKKDLAPFADPGTRVEYVEKADSLFAKWKSRRKTIEASFTNINGINQVYFNEQNISYSSFLACPEMSDLLGVAGMILQSHQSSFFVETSGRRQGDIASTSPAFSLLQEAAKQSSDSFTNVIFVTGDAGAGKTEVLKQLVSRQAHLYTTGEADFLYLYVNAQGRALARLDEALATELQDLRTASLTYHVVPSLARNGILVPVIDGFDELLGVLGYEDAFSSLRRFLDDLHGRGRLIASARSTYYQQEFLSRSNRANFAGQNLKIEPIEILPWGDDEFRKYLDSRYRDEKSARVSFDIFKDEMITTFKYGENKILRKKPFFVAKVADLVLDKQSFTGDQLVSELVKGYIHRERTEKLLDASHQPLLSEDQISIFLRLISEEMWAMETRSIDSESLRLLAELAFDQLGLSSDAQDIILERAPTMAFFSPSSGRYRIEFEHELFFSFFLGNSICSSVQSGASALLAILTRSVLPDNAANFSAMQLSHRNVDLTEIIGITNEVARVGSSRAVQARENAGSLIAACLRRHFSAAGAQDFLKGLELRNIIFAGEDFGGIFIKESLFSDVEFRRSDLTGVKFINCQVERVGLYEVEVDPKTTRLELNGINVEENIYGLRVREDENIIQYFRHDTIKNYLTQCGLKLIEKQYINRASLSATNLLEKLLRKYERSTLFWVEDSENKFIVTDSNWGDLERILLSSAVVTRQSNLPSQGVPRVALKRNFLPYQIMAGEKQGSDTLPAVKRFWELMEARFPSLNN